MKTKRLYFQNSLLIKGKAERFEVKKIKEKSV